MSCPPGMQARIVLKDSPQRFAGDQDASADPEHGQLAALHCVVNGAASQAGRRLVFRDRQPRRQIVVCGLPRNWCLVFCSPHRCQPFRLTSNSSPSVTRCLILADRYVLGERDRAKPLYNYSCGQTIEFQDNSARAQQRQRRAARSRVDRTEVEYRVECRVPAAARQAWPTCDRRGPDRGGARADQVGTRVC